MNKEKLGRKVFTSITLKFNVEGQSEGDYSAVIASYDEDEMFYLDSVYRQTVTEKRVRINFALPGRCAIRVRCTYVVNSACCYIASL